MTATPPAARCCSNGVVDTLLTGDEDICELLIGCGPRCDDFICRDFCAQHLADSLQNAGADNRVMLGKDLQRHMLVDYLARQPAQVFEPVDIPGIHQHAVGKRAGLRPVSLMRLIEQRTHFRVRVEHELIKISDQRFPSSFKQRHSCFDDVALG